MCTLVALAGLAISAASSAVGYAGQAQAAKDQNELYRQNALNANQSAQNQYVQLQQRQIQTEQSATAEKMEVARDARASQATARVAAGEGNVSGLSVAGLLQEFAGRQGTYNASVDQNLRWSGAQTQLEMKGVKFGAQDRINSVPRARKPSFFDAALRIAGAGMDAYSVYKADQAKLEQG